MHKIRVLFIFLLSAVFCWGAAYAYDAAEYYPMQEGNEWVYSEESDGISSEVYYIIEGIETVAGEDTAVVYRNRVLAAYLAAGSAGVCAYKERENDINTMFTPPLVLIPAGLGVGQSKEFSSVSVSRSLSGAKVGTGNEKLIIKREADEDVSVPAGEFADCLKLSTTSAWTKDSGMAGKCNITTWFAKGVGEVKWECDCEESMAGEGFESIVESRELLSAVIGDLPVGAE